jgi:hypothetical protein
MAWQSGALNRLRGFPWADVLLRMLMLHVARGVTRCGRQLCALSWRPGPTFRMSPKGQEPAASWVFWGADALSGSGVWFTTIQ